MTAILRFALPATIYWLHGGLMQHLLLPVNIQLSKNYFCHRAKRCKNALRLLRTEVIFRTAPDDDYRPLLGAASERFSALEQLQNGGPG
jgi:hypothetical protein